MSNDQGPLQSSIDKMRTEVERLVDAARDRGGRALDAVGLKNLPRPDFPAIDLTETNDALHLVADLPGVEADLLDLNVTGPLLRLRGSAPSPVVGTGGAVHRAERHVGSFERMLTLPCTVDADQAHAELRHGVLHVRLPKIATEVGQKIPVRSETPSTSDTPTITDLPATT
jgi:HSP20 family protein